MPITIGFDGEKPFVTSEFDKYKEDVILTAQEQILCNILRNMFNKIGVDYDTEIKLQRRSNSYLSIFNNNGNDFLRVKASAKTTWFSIDTWKMADEYKNDPRFDSVKNKKQRHWKIVLSSPNEIAKHFDLISEAYKCFYAKE